MPWRSPRSWALPHLRLRRDCALAEAGARALSAEAQGAKAVSEEAERLARAKAAYRERGDDAGDGKQGPEGTGGMVAALLAVTAYCGYRFFGKEDQKGKEHLKSRTEPFWSRSNV